MSNVIIENRAIFTILLLAIQKQSFEVGRYNSLEVAYSWYSCDKGVYLQSLNENSSGHVYMPLCELNIVVIISPPFCLLATIIGHNKLEAKHKCLLA